MNKLLLLCTLVSTLIPANTWLRQSSSQPVDYESFFKQDLATKRLRFTKMRPEDRAVVARTQLERWLDANRSQLTPQQLAAIQDRIRTIKPLDYADVVIERDMARAKAFEKPPVNFTRAQLDEMSPAGPCIPMKAR